MAPPPKLIGLDWGTTSLRTFLIADDGRVLDRRDSAAGILNVADGGFEATLASETGPWRHRHGALPLLACGMIGSRQGWHEVAYCRCPAGREQLAAGLASVDTSAGPLHIVPGVDVAGADGVPDVMRGEETQIMGALAAADDAAAGLFVLPGTHSKWALVADGRVVDFATFMTGELFAVLKDHTILGRTMQDEGDDDAAFAQGLAHGRGDAATAGGLLKRLFGVRTLALFDRLSPAAGPSYLSGLLIGCELREALAAIAPAATRLTLIGRSDLARLYATALRAEGLAVEQAAEDAAALGLWRIARAGGLLED